MTEPTTTDLALELTKAVCQCGKAKARNTSLCRHCYGSLPRHVQRRLYQRIGHGYEAARKLAQEFLDTKAALEEDSSR